MSSGQPDTVNCSPVCTNSRWNGVRVAPGRCPAQRHRADWPSTSCVSPITLSAEHPRRTFGLILSPMVDTMRSADSTWSGEKNANARSTDRPPKWVVASRHTSSRASAVRSAFDKAECTCIMAVYHTGMLPCPAALRGTAGPLNFVGAAFERAGAHGAALGRGGRRGLRRGDQLGALYSGDAGVAGGPQRAANRTEVPLGVSRPFPVTLSHGRPTDVRGTRDRRVIDRAP